MGKNIYEFSVSVYGPLEKYNDVLSKARVRIFYKGKNRNRTYITDEFAEHLISTLSYAPVKGIYEGEDYTDHGESRSEGRIYGICPENPNVTWENHLDDDGVERTYACADVLIFTALYSEASDIIGKSQSMELYAPSLKYHEAIIGRERYIVFDDGCFLGLQVLGDGVEPCFEGASFYSLQNSIEFAINKIKEYGGTKMPKINFKLSDSEKFDAIWTLLNPEFNEGGNWTVNYGIQAIYDDYALTYNYETGEFGRAYYKKNDESDMVEITEHVKCYVIDVTENEKSTIDTLRALNGDTYELVSETLTNAQENFEKVEDFSAKIEELNETVATLTTEKADMEDKVAGYTTELQTANDTISTLNEEIASLKDYKLGIEKGQKQAVINQYTEMLDEEVLNTYTEKLTEYSVEELDMHLAYELKKANSSIFTKGEDDGIVPKVVPKTGLTAILSKYKK